MHKFQTILALVLAVLLCAPALAEEWPAEDSEAEFGGEFPAEGVPFQEMPPDGSFPEGGEWGADEPDMGMQDVFDADLLVGYVAADGARMNPFYCNEWDLVSVNQLVFEPLVELNEEQKPSPMLADNWTHQDKTWTFTLRKDIQFHNGMALTAYDVEYTYRQFAALTEADNPYSARIQLLIENLTAVDDYTVQVEAKVPGYILLYGMTFPIVQGNTLYDELARGTGPYWYVRYEMDNAVRIEANPLWWQKQPTLGSIAFRRYEDSGSALEALKTNQLEMLSTRSPNAAISRKLADLSSMDYATMTYEMLVPNLSPDSLMSDVSIRKAVMYALDSAVLSNNAYLDMAIQSEVPILPGSWLYESQSAQYYYSPERALQLLYAAGWEDLNGDMILERVEGVQLRELSAHIITYNEGSLSIRENAADLIASYLAAVGIRAKVEVLDRGEIKHRMREGDYDLALLGMNMSEVPVLMKMLGTDGSANMNNYSDPMMNELIAQTATAEDAEVLKRVYSQIQMKIVGELPVMGLLFRGGTVLANRSLAGLTGIRAMDTFRGLQYLKQ